MDEDVDFSGRELPPLEDEPDQQPPPERPPYSGVSIGSDLVGLQHAPTPPGTAPRRAWGPAAAATTDSNTKPAGTSGETERHDDLDLTSRTRIHQPSPGE